MFIGSRKGDIHVGADTDLQNFYWSHCRFMNKIPMRLSGLHLPKKTIKVRQLILQPKFWHVLLMKLRVQIYKIDAATRISEVTEC